MAGGTGRASKPDNHWLGCLVGCAVAASIQGVVLLGADGGQKTEQRRMKLSDLQLKKGKASQPENFQQDRLDSPWLFGIIVKDS